MKTCPDCGERVYDLGCVNCNESAYIEQQEVFDHIRADEERRREGQRQTLECPCCGDDGAVSANGEFYDGQSLICGCVGSVSVDEDGEAWINAGDEECPPTALCKRG